MRRFHSRDESIFRNIEVPLGEHVMDYDIDMIADYVLGGYEDGYEIRVTEEKFWEVVEDAYRGIRD